MLLAPLALTAAACSGQSETLSQAPQQPPAAAATAEPRTDAPGLDGREKCRSAEVMRYMQAEYGDKSVERNLGGYLTDAPGRARWGGELAGLTTSTSLGPGATPIVAGFALCWFKGSFPTEVPTLDGTETSIATHVVISFPLAEVPGELEPALLAARQTPIPIFAPPLPDPALVPRELGKPTNVVLPQG